MKRRRSRVGWRSSSEAGILVAPNGSGQPTRRALRRALRTSLLLVLLGLVRLAGNPRWRTAVIGAALTVPGLHNLKNALAALGAAAQGYGRAIFRPATRSIIIDCLGRSRRICGIRHCGG